MAMAKAARASRINDTDILRLSYVGLSLKAIGDLLGCHAATITARLQALGVEPVDTRRSFMEQIFLRLTPDQQDLLSHHLFNHQINIHDYVGQLIQRELQDVPSLSAIRPVPLPEMRSLEAEEDLTPEDIEAIEEAKAETGPFHSLEEVREGLSRKVSEIEVPEELVAEAEALETVEPELLMEEVALCKACGEAPEMTGTGICPGCHDEGKAPKTTSLFR